MQQIAYVRFGVRIAGGYLVNGPGVWEHVLVFDEDSGGAERFDYRQKAFQIADFRRCSFQVQMHETLTRWRQALWAQSRHNGDTLHKEYEKSMNNICGSSTKTLFVSPHHFLQLVFVITLQIGGRSSHLLLLAIVNIGGQRCVHNPFSIAVQEERFEALEAFCRIRIEQFFYSFEQRFYTELANIPAIFGGSFAVPSSLIGRSGF